MPTFDAINAYSKTKLDLDSLTVILGQHSWPLARYLCIPLGGSPQKAPIFGIVGESLQPPMPRRGTSCVTRVEKHKGHLKRRAGRKLAVFITLSSRR